MIIESFSIIDFKAKEAQTFEFDKGANLIVSKGNTKGKSSLLKSLYYTLGFDVRQFPSGWIIDDMYFQIKVIIDDSYYTITRQKDVFRVNDVAESMNVKEYSEWISNKLNIHMKLANVHTKKLHSAYSSALILPFYIDQDDSWDGVMYRKVSDTLGQYSRIPKDIFEAIFSLSTQEVTKLKNDLTNVTKKKNTTESTITNFLKVVNEYKQEILEIPSVVKIDKDALQSDINRYLRMLNDFNTQMTKYKMKLLNKQEMLDVQKQNLSELEELLKMNKKRYRSIEAECTYCHSTLTTEKSLTRLDLSNNYFEISLLKDTIEREVEKLTNDIKEIKTERNTIDAEVDKINNEIQKSKELLTIDDYVKASAKNEAVNEMENLVDKQILLKSSLEKQIKVLRKAIKDLNKEKQELRDSIENEYNNLVSKIKDVLTGTDLNELQFLDFKKIVGSGMDKNKKFLAYYLIYFNLLRQKGTYEFPFCMDSFIKNEISGDNATEMFNAIETYFFEENKQTFFSIVSENLKHLNAKESYNKVEVDGKLLLKEKYDEISKRFVFKK
ncbi:MULTISPECIES: hypothetical protein [unclassified Sporosarcina]|uniref:hypothetical protein n=1 Tax=unclassified Sporosarcina TaxID=2647733 RepID=UPI000C1659B5|nr:MULTISPECIES: hypothetical protein [unclassified Sporosarcina]PID05016.1 hypothetical protein CSV66_11990 [Sporosarcina sp. P30]PID08016.1 hypothetical protein CSV65_13130 [Sporosarcina sp. P31]PID11770.1 hypothetical protein CSV64_10225 [Sporosarcina sp. P32b]